MVRPVYGLIGELRGIKSHLLNIIFVENSYSQPTAGVLVRAICHIHIHVVDG